MANRRTRPVLYELVRRRQLGGESARLRSTPPVAAPPAAPVSPATSSSAPAPTTTAPPSSTPEFSAPHANSSTPTPTRESFLPRLIRPHWAAGADRKTPGVTGWLSGIPLPYLILGVVIAAFLLLIGIQLVRYMTGGSSAGNPPAQGPSTGETAHDESPAAPLTPQPPAGRRSGVATAPRRGGNSSPAQPPDGPSGGADVNLPPRVQPPKRDPKETQPTEPGPDSTPPAAFQFEVGRTYIVLQHFEKAKKSAADQAAEFVRAKGVPCTVVEGRDVRLIATEPFLLDPKDPAAHNREKQRLEQFKQSIRRIGKEYAQHGYTFNDCHEQKF